MGYGVPLLRYGLWCDGGVKNGKAVAIQGDPNNHNAGLLCLKGSLLIPVLNSKERVTQPMRRRTKGGP